MYAVLRTGGKQYRVAVGAKIRVETLDAEPGDKISLDDILLISNDGNVTIGNPVLDQAVTAEVVKHGRADKIKVFKMKRRQGYRKTQGHRQNYTELKILSIAGVSESVETAPKAAKASPAAEGSVALTDITGVGPVMAEKLEAAGLTVAKIAALSAADIERIGEELSIAGKLEDWADQAKQLLN